MIPVRSRFHQVSQNDDRDTADAPEADVVRNEQIAAGVRGRGGVLSIRYRSLDQLDDVLRRLEKKR